MTIPQDLLNLADEITLGDLLACGISVDATIRAIGTIATSMYLQPNVERSPDELVMENKLQRIRSSLPTDVVNAAYRRGKEEYEHKLARRIGRATTHAA